MNLSIAYIAELVYGFSQVHACYRDLSSAALADPSVLWPRIRLLLQPVKYLTPRSLERTRTGVPCTRPSCMCFPTPRHACQTNVLLSPQTRKLTCVSIGYSSLFWCPCFLTWPHGGP